MTRSTLPRTLPARVQSDPLRPHQTQDVLHPWAKENRRKCLTSRRFALYKPLRGEAFARQRSGVRIPYPPPFLSIPFHSFPLRCAPDDLPGLTHY